MTECIYHYTNFNGLNGILRDKNLWATNAFASNDRSEINLGIELLKKVLLNWVTEEKTMTLEDIANDLEFLSYASIHHQMSRGTFFSCFSTIRKSLPEEERRFIATNGLLSQWRGYGLYAIKFQKDVLEDVLKKWPTDHTRGILVADLTNSVNYLEAEKFDKFKDKFTDQINAIKTILVSNEWKKIRKQIAKGLVEYSEKEKDAELINNAIKPFLICGFFTKHRGFEEEQEVRIVNIVLPKIYDKRDVCFHAPNKSYIKLFSEDEEIIKEAIKEIIVGPMPNQNLAKKQLESILVEYGFDDDVKITCSKIPFIQH